MPKVLFADYDYHEIALERSILEGAGCELVVAQCRSEDEVIAAARDCAAILLQYAPITARVIAALPSLGLVSRIGAGFDTVDTDAARAHGVWVTNSPDYGVGEVATHALALALASIRNVVAYDRDVRAGKWHFLSSGTIPRASRLTLGIVGLGRIGKRMAHVSRDVFGRVVAFDPYLIDGDFPAYVERMPTLASLAAAADVVSLHTPLSEATRGLISRERLALLRDGATLVNTARGAVVDEDALVDELESGRIGAGLDVFVHEPHVPERLRGLPNVVLTPHIASSTVETRAAMTRCVVDNVLAFARGEPLPTPVS